MVKSVEGIYRNGKVELLESLAEAEGSRVVVTWVHPAGPVNLRDRGIDESQAVDLRRRLAPFAEDWDRPEMAAYDNLPTGCFFFGFFSGLGFGNGKPSPGVVCP